MIEVGNHEKPIIYWSCVLMIVFDSGEVYGRVLFTGTEEQCDAFSCRMTEGGPSWRSFEYPKFFQGKSINQINYNVIATTEPSVVYKQIEQSFGGN